MRHLLILASFFVVAACGGVGDDDLLQDSAPKPDVTVEAEAGPPLQTQSSKIDMLFAIDNSASMGDKEQLLVQALPLLLGRLTTPWCVPKTDPTGVAIPQSSGTCQSGYQLEFSPINDIHMGIVTSSLGGGGSPDVCVPSASNDPTHQDDRSHLINRTRPATSGDPEGSIDAAKPLDTNGGNFLAWVPAGQKVNVTDEPSEAQLETDFALLVNGANEHGCGLEAQLESWYRFLVQPDPYDHITLSTDNPPKATLTGTDATILKQRHDFLRPDSIVMIIQITDEDDSWSDPMWLGGYGWTVRAQTFPTGPGLGAGPRGTHECDLPVDVNNIANTGPNNPDCTSCAFPSSAKPVSKALIGADPNCNACAGGTTTCPKPGWYTPAASTLPYPAADGLNVRYTNDMKRRYGLDPQWNVQRYVDGLSSTTVPDRTHEVHASELYSTTQKNCSNPLFAAALPDGSDTSAGALCNTSLGTRSPSLVYYLIIGGVPWQLLAQDPFNTSLPLKRTLADADWRHIVGSDPAHFINGDIDPHMIESVEPRTGLPAPTSANNADPISGREWNTLTSNAAIDLQYACIFDLPAPKDCTDPSNMSTCDCTGAQTAADGPPLCDVTTPTLQLRGKAYPTIRELRVAKGLSTQGVVASICPRVAPTSYFEVLFTRVRNSIAP